MHFRIPKPSDAGVLVAVVGEVDDEPRGAGAHIGVRWFNAAASGIVFQEPVQDRRVRGVETAFKPLQPVTLLNDLADVPVRLRHLCPGEFRQRRDLLGRTHIGPN